MTPEELANDPFAALEKQRTFIVPNPGARAAQAAPALAAGGGADVLADIAAIDSGMNPLLALANRLLAVVPQIRATSHLADPAALKDSLAQGVREFEARARQQGIAPERAMAARYILCTLLDEAAASTPWGGSGVWGRYSLLAMFHNETWGGEKVFQLMAKLAEAPGTNRDLLELVYAAVCLGFEGRYRVIEGGRAQLDAVRERLAQILQKERGDHAQPLAQHWRGQAVARRSLLSWLPLWVTGAVAALGVLGLYLDCHFRSAACPTRHTARSRACAFRPRCRPRRSRPRNPGSRSSSLARSGPASWRCATTSTAASSRCAATACSSPAAPASRPTARR